MKVRQQGIVNTLYNPSALQCKNCGVRYSSSDMIAYSQHLDWHFRMKRREKDNAKKAKSRAWYYPTRDWIVSEEIEDEEKDLDAEEKASGGLESAPEIPTVPIQSESDAGTCPICTEEFEQFFKQDTMDTPKAGPSAADEDDVDARWHYK